MVVELIPEGRATSYGAIASFLGSPGSSRVVGWAMNASHKSNPLLPAHRVLNRNGLLTGKHHFPDAEYMQTALEKEGIVVKQNRVMNWEKIFWDPAKELDLTN